MLPSESGPNPKIRWSRELTAERYPLPMSPLGWSNLQAVFDEGVRSFARFMGISLQVKEELATLDNGWVVANADAFDFRKSFKIRISAMEMLPILGNTLKAWIEADDGWREFHRLVRFLHRPKEARTKLGNHLDSATLHLASGTVLTFLRKTAGNIENTWPATLAKYLHTVAEAGHRLERKTDWQSILNIGDELRREMILYIKPDLVIYAVKEIASLMLSELATLARLPNPKELPATLGLGLESNVTLEFHHNLYELGNLLRAEQWPVQPLSIGASKNIDAFLARYGHLTTSWDILHPTWGEDRNGLLCLALQTLKSKPGGQNDAESGGSAQSMSNLFFARLAPHPFALQMARELQMILRSFMTIDEEHHFHTGQIIPVTRRLVLRLGEILSRRGILSSSQSIFWLTDAEVRHLLKGSSSESKEPLVKSRKAAYERALKDGPPTDTKIEEVPAERPEIVSPEMAPPTAAKQDNGDPLLQGKPSQRAANTQSARNGAHCVDLSGTGVSSGSAHGPVRRISCMSDLQNVQNGDILLMRFPDPTLTVVFPKAGGVISETGAILSHGAVVAREYRIPAVFGVKKAWSILQESSRVNVNGTLGIISYTGLPKDK